MLAKCHIQCFALFGNNNQSAAWGDAGIYSSNKLGMKIKNELFNNTRKTE